MKKFFITLIFTIIVIPSINASNSEDINAILQSLSDYSSSIESLSGVAILNYNMYVITTPKTEEESKSLAKNSVEVQLSSLQDPNANNDEYVSSIVNDDDLVTYFMNGSLEEYQYQVHLSDSKTQIQWFNKGESSPYYNMLNENGLTMILSEILNSDQTSSSEFEQEKKDAVSKIIFLNWLTFFEYSSGVELNIEENEDSSILSYNYENSNISLEVSNINENYYPKRFTITRAGSNQTTLYQDYKKISGIMIPTLVSKDFASEKGITEVTGPFKHVFILSE